MDAYIYQSALYCEQCANNIRSKLEQPDDPDDESSYDSDDYPKGPYPDGGERADIPKHCMSCHRPLGNQLTPDGIEYVISAFKKHLEDPEKNEWVWNRPQDDGTWYEEVHHWNVLRDWYEQISDAPLTNEQSVIVDLMGEWLERRTSPFRCSNDEWVVVRVATIHGSEIETFLIKSQYIKGRDHDIESQARQFCNVKVDVEIFHIPSTHVLLSYDELEEHLNAYKGEERD